MELVRGIKITDYCDENKLNTDQRLELFIQVCQAIQHAHQKGIIHRDIKPSNILVADHDGVPVPKIIDFGIAKATSGQTLTDKTVFTALEQFIGTPAYMSPEQAKLSGLDIDTRSDIYSLGVLLYELLTGKTPFDAKRLFEAGFDEIRRIIREEEPQRPSHKLSTLAAEEQTTTAKCRQTDSPRLIHLVRGDLDWIVMKCLEKDRNRRYETANGLAMELKRFINNEPIIARPPSSIYRFQKLVRRNKLVFAAAGSVIAALVVGLGFSTWLFVREKQARAEAVAAHVNEAMLRQKAEAREKIPQAQILFLATNYAAAESLLNEIPASLLEANSQHASLRRKLGIQHSVKNQWKEAVGNFAILMRVNELLSAQSSDPDDHMYGSARTRVGERSASLDRLMYGTALAELGDKTGYEDFRQAAITRYKNTTDSIVAERICKISMLLPADEKVIGSLDNLYDVATGGQKNPELESGMKAWASISLGMVDYRRGHYEKSIEWCGQCLASTNVSITATAQLVLAMAHHQLNQETEARNELALGRNPIESIFQKPLSVGSVQKGFYFDWVFARILLREALALIPD